MRLPPLLVAGLVAGLALPSCQIESQPAATEAAPDSVASAPAQRVGTRSLQDSLRPERSPTDSVAPPRPQDFSVADTSRARVDPPRGTRRAAALSALQDLTERAGGTSAQAVGRALDLVDERVAALPAGDRGPALDSLRREARAADRRGDGPGTALAAAEAHRALTRGLREGHPARLQSSALVVGALVRSPLPDWRAVRTASGALETEWARARRTVESQGTRDALTAALEGIQSGADTQNAPLVRLAATIVVYLTDALPTGLPSQP